MSDPHDPFGPLTGPGQTAFGAYMRGQREMLERMRESERKSAEFVARHGPRPESAPVLFPAAPVQRSERSKQRSEPSEEERAATGRALLAGVIILRKPSLASRLAGNTYSYLREDGEPNVDEEGHLCEPELVKWDVHATRLQKAYKSYWETERKNDCFLLCDARSIWAPTPAQQEKAKAIAAERLQLIERGLFLRPGRNSFLNIRQGPRYIVEFRLFGRVLFTMRNPRIRKVRAAAYDRFIRKHVAVNLLYNSNASRSRFSPASLLIKEVFLYPWN